jgi:hypothetical protein
LSFPRTVRQDQWNERCRTLHPEREIGRIGDSARICGAFENETSVPPTIELLESLKNQERGNFREQSTRRGKCHLNGIVGSILLGTVRLYTVSQGCLPFGANDVEPQVEFPTNLTRSIHSDPTNEIISYLLIDPSSDFQFLVSIQLQNLVFDLRGIHTFFTFQIQAVNIDWRNRSHPYFSQRLAELFAYSNESNQN